MSDAHMELLAKKHIMYHMLHISKEHNVGTLKVHPTMVTILAQRVPHNIERSHVPWRYNLQKNPHHNIPENTNVWIDYGFHYKCSQVYKEGISQESTTH